MKYKIAIVLLVMLACVEGVVIYGQRRMINDLASIKNDLIDLNHDKSEYIDGGCKGQFQGSEEMLSHE